MAALGQAGQECDSDVLQSHWLRELTDGSVTMSVGGGEWNQGEMVPLLSNQYAHAAVMYKKELTPDPEVMKQLQVRSGFPCLRTNFL